MTIQLQKQNQRPKNKTKGNRLIGVASVNQSVPIPLQTRCTLQFTDFFTLNASSGVAVYQWSGNSAYDPDYTGIGIQPFYYDQYANLYTKYVVMGAKFTMKYNVDTGSNQAVASVVYPYYKNATPNTPAGLRQAMSAPYSTYKLLINAPVQQQVLSVSMSSAKILNTTNQDLMQNDDWWAPVTSDPSQQWTFKIMFCNIDSAITAFGVSVMVEIEYDIVFKQWADEGPSLYIKGFVPPGQRATRPVNGRVVATPNKDAQLYGGCVEPFGQQSMVSVQIPKTQISRRLKL